MAKVGRRKRRILSLHSRDQRHPPKADGRRCRTPRPVQPRCRGRPPSLAEVEPLARATYLLALLL
eukprot:11292848-Alexandrium_andersonii.AAC.1